MRSADGGKGGEGGGDGGDGGGGGGGGRHVNDIMHAEEMRKLRSALLTQSRREMRMMRETLLNELKPQVRSVVHDELKQERLLSNSLMMESPAVATALKKQMHREVGGMTPSDSLVIGTAVPSWVVETPLPRGGRQWARGAGSSAERTQKASPLLATPGSAGWQLHLMRGENARAVVASVRRAS